MPHGTTAEVVSLEHGKPCISRQMRLVRPLRQKVSQLDEGREQGNNGTCDLELKLPGFPRVTRVAVATLIGLSFSRLLCHSDLAELDRL
jgi:hypothetical protein